MFYFFSTDQAADNVSYFRGLLFEELLRVFLSRSGYEVDVQRRKQNSLEYDLHGAHSLDNRGVVGEAKAHTSAVSGSDVAAFVGKALPYFHGTQQYSGLFLATSALSPDAEDFMRNVAATTPYQISWICGESLERRVRSALDLPTADHAMALVRSVITNVTSQHLLHSNRGTFIVVLGSGAPAAFDDRFSLISAKGELVSDPDLITSIRAATPAFQELEFVTPAEFARASVHVTPRAVPRGLITAGDWFDYRRPASTKFFVGREETIERARGVLARAETGVILEIKSRSGVGKSSVLAVLDERLREADTHVELHDARDVHSAPDVLALVQRFTSPAHPAMSFEDIPRALAELQDRLGTKPAVFMVDQFESTFASPEVFYAYEHVALCISRAPAGVAMVYARKDDLLTTHDEIQVNLDRLRSLSTPIALEDFSRDEALSLIVAIASAYPKKLSPRILAQVLEFAQGFPWLLKRTMAHVAATLAKGTNQQELLSSGLHLEDLFEEELAELDEHERGYLTRLAAVLPATYQVLSRRFEDDPFLRQMLEKLTARRLLRFAAGTYDTYNDVFKDFLLYERLPERSQSQMFRMGLVPAIHAFKALGGDNTIDPETFGRRLGKSLGGTYNILRELRLVGLVQRAASGWSVPAVVREFEHQGRLGEYVRQSVLRSRAVSEFLVVLERRGRVERAEIASFLRHQFPFVDAKANVWDSYARTFVDWLHQLRLVELQRDGTVLPARVDKDSAISSLGNLPVSRRPVRSDSPVFVPSRTWRVTTGLLARANQQPLVNAGLSRSELQAKDELARLGALERMTDGRWRAIKTVAEFEADVRLMLAEEPYVSFFAAVREGRRPATAAADILGLGALAESSRLFLARKLTSWAKNLGIDARRGKKRIEQPSLFDTIDDRGPTLV